MYERWEGYISDAEMNDQFRKDCDEAEQKIKELKEDLQPYAKFCIQCDRKGMKPLDYDSYKALNEK